MIATAFRRTAAALVAGAIGAACAAPHATPGTAERLWIFDVGELHASDVSAWSPGVDVGKPWVFADHCYLIRHAKGLLLWDTGYSDRIAELPDGLTMAGGALHVRVARPLAAQLEALGVRPADVTHLAFSHFHMDHAGNANQFAAATLYVQQVEHDAAFGPAPYRFGFQPALYAALRDSRTVLLHGDCDVFGDGSVVILSTPGHTPGHQSLLVRLPKTGAIVLSGDLAHFQANWDNRRVPAGNFDHEQTLASMARVEELLAQNHATLVIQHDQAQSARLPKAPAFLE